MQLRSSVTRITLAFMINVFALLLPGYGPNANSLQLNSQAGTTEAASILQSAWSSLEQGHYKEALLASYNALKLDPKLSQAYYISGVAYSKTGSAELAILSFNKAITIEPNYQEAIYQRARVHAINKNFENALVDINKLIKIDPNNSEYYRIKNQILEQKNIFEHIENLNAAITANPKDFNSYLERAKFFYSIGEIAASHKDLLKVVELNPFHSQAYYQLGTIEFNLHNFEQAKIYFSKAYKYQGLDLTGINT